MPSPRQKGTAPGVPGAGVTITRSRVISSIRQVLAPSRKVWPGPRLVDHLLVELADPAAVGEVDAVEPAVGDRARRWRRPAGGRLAGRASSPWCGPRRSAAAARRSAPRGSARRACRARSRAARGRAPRRAARRVTSCSTSSISHSSSAAIETRCCASTSSGFCGITVSSISPVRMRRRPPRTRGGRPGTWGRSGPCETSPSVWPARPTRCRPRVTDFGDSTWMTRSTAPMSMPSSRDEVATRQGSCAGLEQLLDQGALLVGEGAVVGPGDLRGCLVAVRGVARRARWRAAPPRARRCASR